MSDTKVRRALLSVSDKSGLIPFAQNLVEAGVALVSTGGTHKTLTDARLRVTEVADLTGTKEMLDGRVKTLHPAVHAGLLADLGRPSHVEALEHARIAPIDLLVVNLYPFEEALRREATPDELVETIDVGGPTMTRAAAKNFSRVTVVVDPDDYRAVADALTTHGGVVPFAMRRRLAAKAFARLAAYDAAIAAWLADATKVDDQAIDHRVWYAVGGRRAATLRYGENPHQEAALYRTGRGLADARQVQGVALSYNNLADAHAAWSAVHDFLDAPAAVIVKHANPCGIAVGSDLAAAYEAARRCDPISAFGGVVALSRAIDEASAQAIGAIFTEVIVAPDAGEAALAILAQKPNVRVLLTAPSRPAAEVRSVLGGLLVQSADLGALPADSAVATKRAPTEAEWRDLRFAWRAVKHVKSNAIVFAHAGATLGIGAGQMSRVDAARIAAWKLREAARTAGEKLAERGFVAASDAFFPFADGLELIAEAGASAVIQPGGSRRDQEVIEAADKAGLAMVMTGMRHFRH